MLTSFSPHQELQQDSSTTNLFSYSNPKIYLQFVVTFKIRCFNEVCFGLVFSPASYYSKHELEQFLPIKQLHFAEVP